jgi:hypothetical protein
MTKKQLELVHHAATVPVDGEQWRHRMVLWLREKRMNPFGVVVFQTTPDEDDDFREARATTRAPNNFPHA